MVCALAFLCSKQAACQQPLPSVLNWMSKSFQCFTICCNVYGGSWGVKSPRRTPFQSQLPWFSCCWCFEFLFHGRISMAPHHQLSYAFKCLVNHSLSSPVTMESRNSLASSMQSVRKVSAAPIQFFFVVFRHFWQSNISFMISRTNDLDTSRIISCTSLIITYLPTRIFYPTFVHHTCPFFLH